MQMVGTKQSSKICDEDGDGRTILERMGGRPKHSLDSGTNSSARANRKPPVAPSRPEKPDNETRSAR